MDFNAITVSTHGMKVQVIYGDLIIAQPEKKSMDLSVGTRMYGPIKKVYNANSRILKWRY